MNRRKFVNRHSIYSSFMKCTFDISCCAFWYFALHFHPMQCKNYGSLMLSRSEFPSCSNSYIPEIFYWLLFLFLSLIPVATSNICKCTKFFPSPHTCPLYCDPSLPTLIILYHPVLKRIHSCATCSLLSFFQ